MPVSRSEILTTDGLRIVAHRWRGEGRPIVFVHGFVQHARVWDAVVRELDETWCPIGLDLRGHGDSSHAPADSGYGLDAYEADLRAALVELACTDAPLVGHSLGARIALRYASRADSRTRAVALVDCGPPRASEGARKALRDAESSPRIVRSPGDYLRAIAPNYPLADRARLRAFAEASLRPTDDGGFEEKFDPAFKTRRSGSIFDPRAADAFWRELDQVRAPTLVARGIGSAILNRPIARQIVDDHLRHGAFAEVRGAGHAIPLDNPTGLASALEDFWKAHLTP